MTFHHTKTLGIVFLMILLFAGALSQIKCDYCDKVISGQYIGSDGKAYHDNCYTDHIQPRCDYCEDVINGAYNILDNKQYHPDCYTNHVLPKCDICSQPLDGQYLSDFWGNEYHESHVDELEECSSCGRLICDRLTRGGYRLNDYRQICNLCNATAIIHEFDIQSSRNFVMMLLESEGILGVPRDVPITLVDAPSLKRLSKINSDAMQGFTDQQAQTINGRVVSRESHIYILSHLPKIVFQSVLAHELLHVYLFENNLRLRSDIREGFCNLGSELIYKSTNSEFSSFRLQNMQENQDPDYGVGYRKMSAILHKKGWRYILNNIDEIR